MFKITLGEGRQVAYTLRTRTKATGPLTPPPAWDTVQLSICDTAVLPLVPLYQVGLTEDPATPGDYLALLDPADLVAALASRAGLTCKSILTGPNGLFDVEDVQIEWAR